MVLLEWIDYNGFVILDRLLRCCYTGTTVMVLLEWID